MEKKEKLKEVLDPVPKVLLSRNEMRETRARAIDVRDRATISVIPEAVRTAFTEHHHCTHHSHLSKMPSQGSVYVSVSSLHMIDANLSKLQRVIIPRSPNTGLGAVPHYTGHGEHFVSESKDYIFNLIIYIYLCRYWLVSCDIM